MRLVIRIDWVIVKVWGFIYLVWVESFNLLGSSKVEEVVKVLLGFESWIMGFSCDMSRES